MFSSRFPPSSTASLCLQMAFHFRLPVFLPIFLFPFLVQYSPSLALYRSLARSLVRSFLHTPHRWLAIPIPLSLGSFSWFFFLFSFFLSFSICCFSRSSSPSPTPCSILPLITFPHYFMSSTLFPIFSSPYFLVHILYISSPLSSFFLTSSQSFPFNFGFVVVLFPNHSSCLSTPAIPSSCHASFFLSFPIFTILLLFVLSFYISFLLALLTFSSHFSTPSSCFFLLTTIFSF